MLCVVGLCLCVVDVCCVLLVWVCVLLCVFVRIEPNTELFFNFSGCGFI